MLDALGSKGSGLHEMANLGLAVPCGFTVTTAACAEYEAGGLDFVRKTLWPEVSEGVSFIERESRKTLFREGNSLTGPPLLLSVRSGAAASMPGMMDSVLNLGLSDVAVDALVAAGFNKRWVYDSYRRLLQMYGDVVAKLPKSEFEAEIAKAKERSGVKYDSELDASTLKSLCDEFKGIYDAHGATFEQDSMRQLENAVVAVFESWNNPRAIEYRDIHRISNLLGTAVNVQQMVYGNFDENSGSGVCFTRNPADGSERIYGEFLITAQGEDVVSGVRTPLGIDEMAGAFPGAIAGLRSVCSTLESDYKDMLDIEFTVEQGELFILQCRVGKRTGAAAVRIATEMCAEGTITRDEALTKVNPKILEQVLHPIFALDHADRTYTENVVAKGLPASPGAAVGVIVFTAEDAKRSKDKPCILVREETSADDIGGMYVAEGILTGRGGMTSHAAVVARGWGKPCVAGCTDIKFKSHREISFGSSEKTFRAGDTISINGTTGEVIAAALDVQPSTVDTFLPLKTLMRWADERRTISIRANADTPEDAATGIRNGATGIGLVRTEHMFFSSTERVHAIREFIIAKDAQSQARALEKLEKFQYDDFRGILKAARGLPVTMRLIDPPLHEFLPSDKQLREGGAHEMSKYIGKSAREIEKIAEGMREKNPMLGFRGCRLGCVRPEMTKMQTRAFVKAAIDLASEGVSVAPEIMVPLVSMVEEFHHQRDLIWEVVRDCGREQKAAPLRVPVGAMIETCRSALIAGELTRAGASFFSFGTNDLTQMTYGLSRDDSDAFLRLYIDRGIIRPDEDPFQTLDAVAVGELLRVAIERARAVRPEIEFGVCGEHGGDPKSISIINDLDIDYSSCSPSRILVARLAGAQAEISSPSRGKKSSSKRVHHARSRASPAA
jgi:pyruvate,orthophosphate dikinase|tara:strand:+ start:2662 stop:5358 length:2697 start_codon:yes stop_codon:yes gene_type:complete